MTLESKIQTDIIRYLKNFGMVYKHPPYPKGIPDIHFIHKGVHLWFEVKRSEKHKPTDIQKYRHKELQQNGDKVFVVWSVKQVKEIVDGYSFTR